ncbi:hypothetical protein KQI84_07520 [bacterium]|nr:hypothetical protein [bacterium]
MRRLRLLIAGVLVFAVHLCCADALTALPDLAAEDIWRDADSSIPWISITNAGDQEADGSIECTLSVDGTGVETIATGNLAPGESRQLAFTAPIDLPPGAIHVSVQVDSGGTIAEGDETNNTREETWSSDQTAPSFVTLPVIDSIAADAVEISVEANEPVTVRVYYGKTLGSRSAYEEILTPSASHIVRIEGLLPDTMHEAAVRITDAAENATSSLPFNFRTEMTTPDAESPVIGLPLPETISGRTIIAPEVNDPSLDRVNFMIDGELIATDYSAPFELDFDATQYPNGSHNINVEAVDRADNRASDSADVSIANVIDTTVPTAQIVYDFLPPVQGYITFEGHGDDDVAVAELNFYVDGICRDSRKYTQVQQAPSKFALFSWDTRKEQNGERYLVVEAIDTDGKKGYANRLVNIENPPPVKYSWMLSKHDVMWQNFGGENYVRVVIELLNNGNQELNNVEFLQYEVHGFQIFNFEVISSAGLFYDYSRTWHIEGGCRYEMEGKAIKTMKPGDTLQITLDMVPVLAAPIPAVPAFGEAFKFRYLQRSYGSPTVEETYAPQNMVAGGMTPAALHKAMCAQSDYIILTCPGELFRQYAGGYSFGSEMEAYQAAKWLNKKVEKLLRKTAELARWRNGVLGFVAPELIVDDSEITPLLAKNSGVWQKQMANGYWGNGYLLLVGEPNIVPASAFSVPNYFNEEPGDNLYCWPSDILYANTVGDYIVPELNVGRIIGNTPDKLMKHIQNSLDLDPGPYALGGPSSTMYLLAGEGKSEGLFISKITSMRDSHTTIYPHITVQADFLSQIVENTERTVFDSKAPSSGLIGYFGHGWTDGWDDIVPASFPLGYFGNTRPIMIGTTCLSGSYYPNSWINFSGNGMPDALVERGVPAYIGAIQVTGNKVNDPSIGQLFWYLINYDKGIGYALDRTRSDLYPDSSWHITNALRNEWIVSYNLYGDPKIGKHIHDAFYPTGGPRVEAPQRLRRSQEVIIDVPDYSLNATDEGDIIEIGNQPFVLETGKPLVPSYTEEVLLDGSLDVSDVILLEKSAGEVFSADVALALFGGATYYDPKIYAGGAGPEKEVWPDHEFSWSTRLLPSGDRLLRITVYPLQQSHLDGVAEFTNQFRFQVETQAVGFELTSFSLTNQQPFRGDSIDANVEFSWTGGAGPLYAGVRVLDRAGVESTAGGTEVRTLAAQTPLGLVAFPIDTSDLPIGAYVAQAEVWNEEGTILATTQQSFDVRAARLELGQLTANHGVYYAGDTIALQVDVTNNGIASTDGTLIVEAFDSQSDVVQSWEMALPTLAPAGSITEEWSFTIPGVAEPAYRVTSFVIYEGRQSPASSLLLTEHTSDYWLLQ